MRQYYVYILTNKKEGVLYVGVTNNLKRRIFEHKTAVIKGFTYKYSLHKLVYFCCFCDVREAIKYEKKLKRWKRQWKIDLVNKDNKNWDDLDEQL